MHLYRFDLTFSYWIFAWYLLFIAGFIKASPKLAILLGILIHCLTILYCIMTDVPLKNIYVLFTIMIIIKTIPYVTLYNIPFSWTKDWTHFIILYLIYLLWMKINKLNPIVLEKNMISAFRLGTFSPKWTPGTAMINDVYKFITD